MMLTPEVWKRSRYNRYCALTHHIFWDGDYHYWTGMVVKGVEDQNPDNPNCCHDLSIFEGGEVVAERAALVKLRSGLKSSGKSHKEAGARLGMGLSRFRQRLYGRRPFSGVEFNSLCRLAGLNPLELASTSGER